MTLFIQRANRRDNLALHAKVDELLRCGDRIKVSGSDAQSEDARSRAITGGKIGKRRRPLWLRPTWTPQNTN
jgi:hypothetical protein